MQCIAGQSLGSRQATALSVVAQTSTE